MIHAPSSCARRARLPRLITPALTAALTSLLGTVPADATAVPDNGDGPRRHGSKFDDTGSPHDPHDSHDRRADGHRGRDHHPDHGYAIGLWGDLPYSVEQATTGVPNLVADMNAHDLAFTVNDGDLKAGSGACTDSVYHQALATFNQLSAPAMFTPGDNDWVDCDRPTAGGYDSLERLEFERNLFFATSESLGQRRMPQEVQSDPACLGSDGGMKACAENRRWTHGGVTFLTVNVQGSCNNLCDTAPNPAEYMARNQANIRWMRDTFAQARAHGSAAVMLISQANPGWDRTDPTRAPLRDPNTLQQADEAPDGFGDWLRALREEVIAFRKPVAYVHGDSHYFRVDKPLLDDKGRRLENFTRVETFGDNQTNGNNDVQWVRIDVDADSREVFRYQPMIVPTNRVAVQAP